MNDIFTFQESIGVFDDNLIDVNLMLSSIYNIKHKESQSDRCSNLNGWQKHLDCKLFQPFVERILINFNAYIRDALGPYRSFTLPTAIVKNMFCNINPTGTSNIIHDHSGSHFSGVYWLKAPVNSGDLMIMSPFRSSFLNHTNFAGKAVKLRRGVERHHSSIRLKPFQYSGAFFNASLVHYTDINRSDSDRVSIAFNINMV